MFEVRLARAMAKIKDIKGNSKRCNGVELGKKCSKFCGKTIGV